ncbi:5'-nucleotidase SurE [Nitrospira sp. KM1]|uniref:5'/3'-nucleotidase SurE n=1 Tax=Nitrospira sp. KM1 TaxID=1936990 RepID=UPI0013A720F7|nr:5'/3'-nucleotidase SurE [Nitrospira sp. KM1]BCA54987.1 5'-nucleotidase SurE [Nitrospira sp. KM1]
MSSSRIRILVTNDDGIHSAGLSALAKALARVAEVWVVAPDRERTAVAHAVTLHKPLRVHQFGKRVYAINGTPVDCVNLALATIMRSKPHLLVSGINKGVNLGDDVLYSGTVSAAVEGTILGIPSMAVSQEGKDRFRFDVGAHFAVRVARLILKQGLPEETLINLNIPDCPASSIPGVRITCLSRRRFDNPIVEKIDPHGRTYYWIAGTRISWSRNKDADHEAIAEGSVSLTPIYLDSTHYGVLDRFRSWEPVLRGGSRPRRRQAGEPTRKRG